MHVIGATYRIIAGLLALTLLAGCPGPKVVPPNSPPARPANLPPPPPEVSDPSEESVELSLYYQRVQNDLLTQGLLRGDGGGVDTPFTDVILTRDFVRIALFDEYAVGADGELRAEATVSRLRRWEQPVRMSVEFGTSVPLAQRDRDNSSIGAYANRLSQLTGLEITQTQADANFFVFVLNEGDRAAYEDRLREIVPNISDSSVLQFLNPARETFCLAVSFSRNGSPEYDRAIILIRGEHPDLLRLACIHEELAQALGLANDSPSARPSIFNDDQEFGRLTTHDELLLTMLYDPRLEPGMSAAEAAPIAREIATELIGDPS